jgi:hypothetical protein
MLRILPDEHLSAHLLFKDKITQKQAGLFDNL